MPEWLLKGLIEEIPKIESRERILDIYNVAVGGSVSVRRTEFNRTIRNLQREAQTETPKRRLLPDEIRREFGFNVIREPRKNA